MFFPTINLKLALPILLALTITSAVPFSGQSTQATARSAPRSNTPSTIIDTVPFSGRLVGRTENPPQKPDRKQPKANSQSTKTTTKCNTSSASRYQSTRSATTSTTLSTSRTTSTRPIATSPPETCPTPLNLGLALDFAALGASSLTSTGLSVLVGDAGVFPGTSITGFPLGVVTGTIYSAQAPARQAKEDCQRAFTAGFAKVASATVLAAELGGTSLPPGVYTFPSLSAGITGTLTLRGSGVRCGGGQFIFIIPTTLTTAAASAIVLANGARACNVYFLMGTSATIGAGSSLKGNFIASASITAGEAAENAGTFCALTAAITLINDDLTAQGRCSA